MTTARARSCGLTIALVAILGWITPVNAETDPAKAAYLKYCSACHGEGGKGDGVASGFLRPKPPDLTQLAKQAGGEFPMIEVVKTIDGTKTVGAHGGTEMPVWGEVFRQETGGAITGESQVRGKVMLIADHLRRIQEK